MATKTTRQARQATRARSWYGDAGTRRETMWGHK